MARRALAEVRSIGTAFEAFAVDTNAYPTADAPGMQVSRFQLHRVVGLTEALRNYIGVLPTNDPWGKPYLFWTSAESYLLASLGSDGALSDLEGLESLLDGVARRNPGEAQRTSCLEDELIFSNGAFLRWPRDPVKTCGRERKTRI